MRIVKRDDGYEIVDTPPGVDEMGPYNTKAEALDDLRGAEQFCRDHPEEESERDGPALQ